MVVLVPMAAAQEPPPEAVATNRQDAAAKATAAALPCFDGPYAAMINGRQQTMQARLCEMPDGSWRATPQ